MGGAGRLSGRTADPFAPRVLLVGGDGIGCFPQISQICADLGSGDGWPQKGAKGANGEGKALEYVFTNGVYFEYARLVWALLLRH